MAVAANMDLGRAADIASNILSGFNLDASRTAEVADVLAQASRTANVDVEMLGQTMKFVAPAASAVGGSLQENRCDCRCVRRCGDSGDHGRDDVTLSLFAISGACECGKQSVK